MHIWQKVKVGDTVVWKYGTDAGTRGHVVRNEPPFLVVAWPHGETAHRHGWECEPIGLAN